MIKTTRAQLFISRDPLPENPTEDDFKALEWVEVGGITKPPKAEFTYTQLKTKVIKRTGTYAYTVGKIKKPKRARFGRVINWRQQ